MTDAWQVCPWCGAEVPPGTDRCGRCGQQLGPPAFDIRGAYAPPPFGAPEPPAVRIRNPLLLAAAATVAVLTLGVAVISMTRSSPVPFGGTDPTLAGGAAPVASATTEGARSYPRIGDGAVFFFEGHDVVARGLDTGTERWRHPLSDCPDADWGDAAREKAYQPILVRCGTSVQAVDWRSGTTSWTIALEAERTEWVAHSASFVVLAYKYHAVVLDARTGAKVLRKGFPGKDFTNRPVAVDEQHLYVGGDVLWAFDVRSGEEAWHEASVLGITVADGTLFAVSDGYLMALDAATGRARWSTRDPDARLDWATLAGTTAGTLVVRNRAGGLVAFDVASGVERWSTLDGTGPLTPGTGPQSTRAPVVTTEPPADAASTMSMGDGYVVTTGSTGLYLIEATTGRVRFEDQTIAAMRAAVGDGHLAFVDSHAKALVVLPLP